MIKLVWKKVSVRGSCRATTPKGIYFIQAVDDGFIVSFQGTQIAKASSLNGAKDYALIHVNKVEG